MVFNDSALAKFSVAGLKTRLLPVGAKLRDLPDTSILANRDALKNKRAQLIGFARALAMGYHFTVEKPGSGGQDHLEALSRSRAEEHAAGRCALRRA